MAQFRFRLQSVLEYRRSLSDQMQVVLADRERQLRDAERRLAELHQARDQAHLAWCSPQDSLVDLSQASQIGIHIEQIEADIEVQLQCIERARLAYEETRAELLELEKAAKSLEKLRDRQQDEWTAEELRREQVELNELATVFHQRFGGG